MKKEFSILWNTREAIFLIVYAIPMLSDFKFCCFSFRLLLHIFSCRALVLSLNIVFLVIIIVFPVYLHNSIQKLLHVGWAVLRNSTITRLKLNLPLLWCSPARHYSRKLWSTLEHVGTWAFDIVNHSTIRVLTINILVCWCFVGLILYFHLWVFSDHWKLLFHIEFISAWLWIAWFRYKIHIELIYLLLVCFFIAWIFEKFCLPWVYVWINIWSLSRATILCIIFLFFSTF